MDIAAADFPEGINELDDAGLTARASKQIATPCTAESPVSFECRLFSSQALPFSPNLVPARSRLHIRDELIDEKMHVDVDGLDLVARMHGSGWYTTTRDRFQLDRMTVDEWKAKKPR